MRPSIWTRFVEERDRQRESFSDKGALEAAEGGTTGIDVFDHYARELVTTGYIHNHARMWFASIWIFTLGLPWALGADFFLRHLLDADAASNTLSWRWVGGLQTVGKTYHATAHNIARYTNGRFSPAGLAREAVALTEAPIAPAQPLPTLAAPDTAEPSLLLVTHEDMHPESYLSQLNTEIPIVGALVAADDDLLWGDRARAFVKLAGVDTASRITAECNYPAEVSAKLGTELLLSAAKTAGVRQIVTAYTPVGPVADALATLTPALKHEGIALTQIRRPWDEQFWPQAKKGFFTFKERIPSLLRAQGLQ